ncbi:MAG: amidohydrolase family protein [Firmicutes bacterium]|nr:amidohydrolase family protein [Bacillota bacterium]
MTIQEKMQFMHSNPVISWHEHAWFKPGTLELDIPRLEKDLETLDVLGIDQMVISNPVNFDKHCSPELFMTANNTVYEAIQRYPDMLYGMAFINPGYHDAMIKEIERCVNDLGFVGIKLYHQYFMDDPAQFALVEKSIALDVPVLMHSAAVTDAYTKNAQPRLSNGVHMANIAKRYPEATLLMGHIGGGGDWQWSVKAIADYPNVYADMSGSVHDRPLMEESVKYLGADRILFATDGTWDAATSKILGAKISDEEKKTILAGTAFQRFLKKAKK